MSMAATVSHTSTLPSRGYFATTNSRNITERIHGLLTERECSIFDKGLAAYHKRKDVTSFVEALSLVLNTNPKRQLLVPIRDIYIKPSDMIKFNSLAIKYGIALPMRGTTKIAKKGHGWSESGPKVIELKRDVNQDWGFSIRGGSEHGFGIFISWVDSGSNAEKAGLRIGDYVHRVNELSMDGLTHAQATQVFKHRNKISLVITSYGKIPGFQFANKSYRWADSEGKPTTPPTEMESIGIIAGGYIDPTIKKVSFNVEPGKELGVSIRGGAEHGLAIYVSAVDKGSVADLNGIKLGDQILEVNGISYINILHPDAAKGLKQQRQMTMKLKEIGKLPQAKIVPGQWQPPPSLPPQQTPPSVISQISQPRSLPGTMKRGPAAERNAEVIATAPMTSAKHNVVMLKKTTSPARGIMNDAAQSLLSKPEMSTFTYYITRYEHNQIGIEELVQCLLKLFNTSEKIHLLSEVRNIVRPQDLDIFNELTIRKEIIARKNRTGSISSSDDEGAMNRIANGRHPPENIEERDNDSLDEIPQRMSPIQVPTFHVPPPPARRPPPTTSTPEQQQIIAQAMRDRRLDLHESVLEEDGWEDTIPRSVPAQSPANMVDEATLQRKLQEAEEKAKQEMEAKLKQEFEQQQQQMLEAKLREEKAAIEAKLQQEQQQILEAKLQEEKVAIEQEKAKLLEDQKRQFSEEREVLEKKLHELQEQSAPIDKNKLEEEIWRQAEDSLRQELTDEIRKESENKMKKEFERKLETSLAEERRKTEAEKRKREEFEKQQRAKDISKQEEEEQMRIETEQKIRQEAEELARQEYEARLQRESEEKARLAEEIKSYRTMKDKMESERKQREKLEKAKKEAEEKVLKEAKEKTRLETLLKEKEEELAKKEQEKEIAAMEFQTVPYQREESDDEEEELRRQEEEEEELRRQEEEEEELRRQEEEELRRQEEELRRQEELKRQEELRKKEEKARKDDEKRRRQEEKEKARRAEQERLKRLREEEEKRAREEEERREQEELEQQREEDARLKKEEKRVSKEGSFFDPALMDDLVMDIGSVAPPPSSNTRPGHVSFQDQRTQQQKIIENERKIAEQMLANRLRQKKETETGLSYGGYTGLKGTIDKVNVTKVNRKLGIAVDGGANTKQKAVIIRQIVPEGSAALTGKGLQIGQQILAVNGKSLKGLKHKEAVLAVKNAFEGPMQKVVEFVLLTPE